MRFDYDNIHGQCTYCNRYLEGNTINYRFGLIKRYGKKYVESLEKRQLLELDKLDIDQVEQINKTALSDIKKIKNKNK
jgi:hypothetical protein